jgi:2-keto-3-deoxy-L-rhamnonate aldolase RhmA
MSSGQPWISNTAKRTLKEGGPLFAFNVFESLRPSIVKIVAQAGYDMLMVENEHVLHNEETLTNFLVIARDTGLCPAVTIQAASRAFVSRLLDAGALGLGLCHSETPEQVSDMVRWMKYPPVGERALAPGPNVDYQAIHDVARYCAEANDSTLLTLKIESRKGIENAEALMSNEWVDVIIFGPGDLAADMGLHGQWEHPDVLGAMEGVIELALARGIAVEPAIFPQDRETFDRQRERGIQIFGPTRRSEFDVLREAAAALIAPFRD